MTSSARTAPSRVAPSGVVCAPSATSTRPRTRISIAPSALAPDVWRPRWRPGRTLWTRGNGRASVGAGPRRPRVGPGASAAKVPVTGTRTSRSADEPVRERRDELDGVTDQLRRLGVQRVLLTELVEVDRAV